MSLPTPPLRSDGPATFADRGDAFLAALPQFEIDMNAVAAVANDALAVAPAAVAAAQYLGDYSAGATYAIGKSVSYGGFIWYAKTVNTGVTPAVGANWQQVIGVAPTSGHAGEFLTTDGSATSWAAITPPLPARRAFFSATGTHVIPPGVTTARCYAFGAGAAGTTTRGGAGGGCAYGDISVQAGQTLSITISGGVATVSYAAVTLLTANAASGIVGGTASKHASAANGGAYAGGACAAAAVGGAASGSPLGAGVLSNQSGGCGWGGVGSTSCGGGVGGAATTTMSGPGLPAHSVITEPLLYGLTASGEFALASSTEIGNSGGPGAGGSNTQATGSTSAAGAGGFGAGGGSGGATSTPGGAGGFGGGGGKGANTGGAGGFGGGGGSGSVTGGAGGGAAVLIYY